MTRHRNRARGFSLIELMVALLLSAFVLMAVVGLFNQSKVNQVQNEQIARMQENGRYALRLIARDIGMAGYFGGLLSTTGVTVTATPGTDCNAGWMVDMEPAIEFHDDVTASAYTCIDSADILDGTDVIATKRVADNADRSAVIDPATGSLSISGNLNANAIYLKTNGDDAQLFETAGGVDNGPEPPDNASAFDTRQYYPQILYVAPDFTLRRQTLKQDDMTEQTLVDGIEDVQVEFGVDGSDADLAADYYQPDPTNAEILDSVTARIYVLVRSTDPIAGYVNDKTYNLGTKVVPPFNDGYYRRVYSRTVAIRNSDKLKMQAM